MKEVSDRQLDMSYAGDERFSEMLRNVSFVTMLELHHTRGTGVESQLKDLLEAAAASEDIQALMVDDRLMDEADTTCFEMVREAVVRTGKPVVPVVAGKDALNDNVTAKLNRYRAANLRSFLAVTGNLLQGHRAPDAVVAPGEYEDSIGILHLADAMGDDNCVGVAVNPFKYVPEDQLAQYVKLMRKLNNGAAYIVSQAGWDMKKYQELLWFVRCRNVLKPLLARVLFWNASGRFGAVMQGVPVSLKVSSLCEDRDAAIELAALVALGCRRMGYNGIVLAGVEDGSTLREILGKMRELETRYPDYETWCLEWNRRFNEASFLPYSDVLSKQPPFYLYGALMNPALKEYDETESRPAMQNIDSPAIKDKMQEKVSGTDLPEWLRKTAEKITGGNLEDADYLAPCFGLNNIDCPKRLVLGTCGGSAADGVCESGGKPCFFERVVRLAVHSQRIGVLEDTST